MAYNKLFPSGKIRVAIYVRVSTLYQADKDSLPMQRQDLIAYAKLILGTDDYVIFEDAGYSGKNTDRPKYQEMMSQIRSGNFTHLLVWKIDRISRNLLDFAAMYNEIKDLGVVFVSKNEQFDTSTAMGEAMLKIILVFAELERNMTSERVTATMISRASNGHWNGGRIPYGYSYDSDTSEFSIEPEESKVVQLMFDIYPKMRSLVRLARYLNENGYHTRGGFDWSPTSIHIIFHNAFYTGDYVYNKNKDGNRAKTKDESEWVTVENHHPAIISREQKDAVSSILDENARMAKSKGLKPGTKHIHVFGGLMMCGNCGKPMGSTPVTRYNGWKCSTYICLTRRKNSKQCNGRATSDSIVGEFVINYILNMLNSQRDFNSIHSPEELEKNLLHGDTYTDISSIEMDGLVDLYNVLASGKVNGEVFGKGVMIKEKSKIESEIANLRKKKQKLERALDRLTNLYLYSDDAMSDREFIVQKSKIIDEIEEINDQIGLSSSDDWSQSVSDEIFIQRASEFIISQKFVNRKYINYQRLARSVEAETIKNFMQSIIDSIVILDGKIKTIVFKNGLSHTFNYKS